IRIEILHVHAQMINAAARCCRRAASAAASPEHEKLDTISGAQKRRIGAACRSLITLNAPAEQILIELVRPVRIRSENCAVTPSVKRHQSFLRRLFRRRTYIAERSGFTAVPRILELVHDAVGIGERELRG